MADKASLEPSSNHLTAVDGETFTEEVRATLPGKGMIPTIDVYFLTDATGSMSDVISEVNSHSKQIVNGLQDKANSVGADIRFGAGNYTDFDVGNGMNGFRHQESLTYDFDKVKNAIASWSTLGNNTTAEQQLYALNWLAQQPGGEVDWRADAKRIILWFGDAPGHDAIPANVSGERDDITTRSVIAKLQAQDIFVLAFDTTGTRTSSSPGLDTDPDEHDNIGSGAESGQASAIVGATNGHMAEDVKVNEVVDKILKIGGAAITEIHDVKLVPSKSIRPFVRKNPAEIAPRGGARTLQGGQPHEVTFDVPFVGLSQSRQKPPETNSKPVKGDLELWVDGAKVGKKDVDIAIPDLAGTYRIQNTKSEYFLETDPNYTKNGGVVRQRPSSDGDHQKWELIPVPGGGYSIKNKDTGTTRYIEVKGQSADNGSEILTHDNADGKHKQWDVIPTGSDEDGTLAFRLQNVNSTQKARRKMTIDLSGRDDPKDSKVIQWKYWGDYPQWYWVHNQHFRLIRV